MSDSAPAASQHTDVSTVPASASSVPTEPLSPATPLAPSSCLYRTCACLGVLPGKACPACYSSKWQKRCQRCHGAGFWFKNTSQNHPRQEPCAECNKRGWKPVMPREREQAAAAYAAWKQQAETLTPSATDSTPAGSPIRVAAKSTRK